MTNDTLLLSNLDLQKLIGMAEVVQVTEDVFRQHGLEKVAVPAKITLNMRPFGHASSMNAMPAFIENTDTAGLKWVGGFMDNRSRGLPYVMGMLLLIDPSSGKPLAVMEASWITAVRTGAAAAVAAKYLAPEGAKTAAIVGAGVQGRTTLAALHVAMDLDEVRVADMSADALSRFTGDMRDEVDLELKTTQSVEEAVRGAEVIVACTTADERLVMESWVHPKAVVVALGSYPELEQTLVLNATKIVVDHREQTSHRGELSRLFEGGDLNHDSVYAELGYVVAGKVPAREESDGIIVVVPIGMGSQDVAVAKVAYDRARESGLGQTFKFFYEP